MMPQEDRRKSKPEFRGKKERREEMKIVVSATQNDIYLWMGSIAMMVAIIGIVVTLAVVKG
ncbi:MAG: hypothetical protein VX730_06105 [Pseudomonadota bacterium]|nr:hypothetical protein [Pseudomonadota bacterium]